MENKSWGPGATLTHALKARASPEGERAIRCGCEP